MSRKLEQFLHEHLSAEDPILEELYRQTHIRFVNPNMSAGHLRGKFLEFISRILKPANILEIGTFTGYSAICLARGLKPDGKLITIEINDELSEFAQSYFRRAGMESRIVQMTGRARDIIPSLTIKFDLVYIDGDKREYMEYYNLATGMLNPGGVILVDNVIWGGKALDRETSDPQARGINMFNEMIRNDTTIEKLVIPVRDGIMMIMKKEK